MKGVDFTIGNNPQFHQLELANTANVKIKFTAVNFIVHGRIVDYHYHVTKKFITHKFICAN